MNLGDYKRKCNTRRRDVINRPVLGSRSWKKKTSLVECDVSTINSRVVPLIDLLLIDNTCSGNRGFLTRACYYGYVATMLRTVSSDYPRMSNMKKELLLKQSLHSAIQKTIMLTGDNQDLMNVQTEKEMEESLMKQANKILDFMLATVTSPVIRFCGWLYIVMMQRLTSAVHLHPGQVDVIKKLSTSSYPIVYLPLHFSHLDYILLSLALFHSDIRCPFVASGDNLHLPLFSYFMRRAGGFFIRRKSNNNSKRDLIYREILNSYITELLKQKQSIEFFIEGGRTRSGLPSYPKAGLLSIMIEAIISKQVEDIIIIPTCTSYDKLIEGNFSNELLGLPKRKESFLNSLMEIGRMLCGSGTYGHIRMNFGQPRLLKETMLEICDACEIEMSDLVASSREKNNMIVGSYADLVAMDQVWKSNINLVAEHIIFACLKAKSFMSTNLVAFLLLHRFREGVAMSTLIHSFEKLNSLLLVQGREVGYCGEPEDIVLHALSIFGSKLIICESKSRPIEVTRRASQDSGCEIESEEGEKKKGSGNQSKTTAALQWDPQMGDSVDYMNTGLFMEVTKDIPLSRQSIQNNCSSNNNSPVVNSSGKVSVKPNHYVFVKPNTSLPEVLDLVYYANALVPVFAVESIIALAVTSIIEFQFSTLIYLQRESSRPILISSLPNKVRMPFLRSKLLSAAMDLTNLLCIDIILCDVTDDIEQVLSAGIDSLVTSGCLISEQYGVSAATRKNQMARELCFEEEDDLDAPQESWIKIDLQNVCDLLFYQSILSSHVKGYSFAARNLHELFDDAVTANEFIVKMTKLVKEQAKDESCSSAIMKSALRSFIENGVIDKLFDGSLALTIDYNDKQSIEYFHERYLQYLP